ncbi:hypothetical protein WR25_09906 [Diploscapter pachys]|uniref:C2H2-type domain-containing protein n=1 Tax=Diploscapter pachys TaxID=2018661 RepID=A0A2A2JC93_9BILA|nr:hypothetical protein WR25_09906 [Diploscapter pachys]
MDWGNPTASGLFHGSVHSTSAANSVLQNGFECCLCTLRVNSIEQIKFHLMREHLQYTPWYCGKTGCGVAKCSQPQLEEHQIAHHGEEGEMRYIPIREKGEELERHLQAVKHGLKINRAHAVVHSANQATGSQNSFATPNLPQQSALDDYCALVHMQSWNPNALKSLRRSYASPSQNNGSTVISRSISFTNSSILSYLSTCYECDSKCFPQPARYPSVSNVFRKLFRFSCTFPGCKTTGYRRGTIVGHIHTKHKGNSRAKVREHYIPDLAEKVKTMLNKCFGDHNDESDDVQQEGVSAPIPETSSKESNEEEDEVPVEEEVGAEAGSEDPKRKKGRPKKEEAKKRVRKSNKSTTTLFCQVCQIDVRVFDNRTYTNLVHHVEKHMDLMHSKPRYKCAKCDYATKHKKNIYCHIEFEHEQRVNYEDQILTWTVAEIRDVSLKCFKQKNFVEQNMPIPWKKHHKAELKKNKKSAPVVGPDAELTSQVITEQQESQESEEAEKSKTKPTENDECEPNSSE